MDIAPDSLRLLTSISPSRFTSLKDCALREALAWSRARRLLPGSPKGFLGSVAHGLIEDASIMFPVGSSHLSLEDAWEERLRAEERKLRGSNMESHLVPLSASCTDYYVIKEQTMAVAERQLSKRGSSGSSRESVTFAEEPLASRDKLLVGRIDRLARGPEGWVVSDYKTGKIMADESEQDPHIKDAYVVQLKLYAMLVKDSKGEWPARLELIPLFGDPVEVPFNRDECSALAAEAKTELAAVNRRVAEVKSGRANPSSLASPSADACRFCSWRPSCVAYWRARPTLPETPWPHDASGRLHKRKPPRSTT